MCVQLTAKNDMLCFYITFRIYLLYKPNSTVHHVLVSSTNPQFSKYNSCELWEEKESDYEDSFQVRKAPVSLNTHTHTHIRYSCLVGTSN